MISRNIGDITPRDQGQTCYRESWDCGAAGCVIRHVDRSEPPDQEIIGAARGWPADDEGGA